METRQKDNVYLIGSYDQAILGSKLPSYRQAFGYFIFLHKTEKKTIRDASNQTITEVITFWDKAGIPTRARCHCIKKLESVFFEWKGLLKHNIEKEQHLHTKKKKRSL